MKSLVLPFAFLLALGPAVHAGTSSTINLVSLERTFELRPDRALMTVGFSVTTTHPSLRRPILRVVLLIQNRDGSLCHYTFVSTDFENFLNQYHARGQLRELYGQSIAGTSKNIIVDDSELLRGASQNTAMIAPSSLRAVRVPPDEPQKFYTNIQLLEDSAIILRVYADLWLDGAPVAKYTKDTPVLLSMRGRRTAPGPMVLARRDLPNDWFVYAKYPDHIMYTTDRLSGGSSPSNIKHLLQDGTHLPPLEGTTPDRNRVASSSDSAPQAEVYRRLQAAQDAAANAEIEAEEAKRTARHAVEEERQAMRRDAQVLALDEDNARRRWQRRALDDVSASTHNAPISIEAQRMQDRIRSGGFTESDRRRIDSLNRDDIFRLESDRSRSLLD
jgi:hypothetical protein